MDIFKVDKSLEFKGVFQWITDSGCKYIAHISESAPNSGLVSLDFIKISGNTSPSEIFKTMRTLYEVSTDYLVKRGFPNLIVYIDGENREIIDKKTRAFTRWINTDIWEFKIDSNPKIVIPNKRDGVIELDTNVITIKKRDGVIKNIIKFCSNCGIENKEYKFCPNCGINLQQE